MKTTNSMHENTIKWYNLKREESIYVRLNDKLINNTIKRTNPAYAINIYKNAISKDDCTDIINKLETSLGHNQLNWSRARVNLKEFVDDVRSCVDFKYSPEQDATIAGGNSQKEKIKDIYETILQKVLICLNDYESLWHLKMNYIEAFNFVKYEKDNEFKLHVDHGPYYSCTVSLIVYLNDNYEGGEINFPRQNIFIKPEAGDIAIFPSNFVYEHKSTPIKNGIKYNVVIMTDYNDKNHQRD